MNSAKAARERDIYKNPIIFIIIINKNITYSKTPYLLHIAYRLLRKSAPEILN